MTLIPSSYARTAFVCGLAFLLCLLIMEAEAQLYQDLYTLTDPNPTDGIFGNTVTISGDYLLAGDPLDDTGGYNTGQAYLFDVSTGNLLHTLLDPTPSPFGENRFGNAVAIAGSTLLIGDHLDDSQGTNIGQAHLFDAVTGSLIRTLQSPVVTTFDDFGSTVALSDDYAVVGAPGYRTDLDLFAGRVYVFDPATGALLHTLDDPTPTQTLNQGNEFGKFVAVSGDLILVADPFDDTDAANAGQVHLFDATTGGLLRTFNAPTPAEEDWFGFPWVEVSGDEIYIRSQGGGDYWFDAVTGELVQEMASSSDLFAFIAETDGEVLISSNTGISDGYIVVGDIFNKNILVRQILPGIPGDYNNDGAIDEADYGVWANAYGSDSQLAADGNGDGVVNAADYTIWRDAYETSLASAVPEPTALLLTAMMAGVGIVGARRRFA